MHRQFQEELHGISFYWAKFWEGLSAFISIYVCMLFTVTQLLHPALLMLHSSCEGHDSTSDDLYYVLGG